MKVQNSKIELLALGELKASPRNARTHSRKQVDQIAKSMKRFGFTNPLLIDDDNVILAGHGRSEAARRIGLESVPCIRLSGMSDADKRAYLIADNKLALNAGWDVEVLTAELNELLQLNFDIDAIGFDLAEVDTLLVDASEASMKPIGPEDEHVAPAASGDAVSKPGDLWILGRHRLLCGDAKNGDSIAILMAGDRADMAFVDPPYNVPIGGHVCGLGQVQHREFAEASGEMSSPQFTDFLSQSLEEIERSCRNGAIVFTCMDWRHLPEILAAGHAVFNELKNLCVWAKTNGGMGTFYRSQHELILVWKVGDAPHTNTFGLGDKGRYRTNVWSYPGVNSFGAARLGELKIHPTVKPVALVADAIRDVSHRGDIVLDTFGGSGTTLIAAEKVGRSARLMEIDPAYCDVIVNRWQRLTGKQAVLATTGQTFQDVVGLREGVQNSECAA